MIGGAFVDQGAAMVRPGGPCSADLLPLALVVAGLKPAGPTMLVCCQARNGQRRVTRQGALSVVERPLFSQKYSPREKYISESIVELG